jgi:peptidyl-prolyl cis-trans isomerase B (cyclophilin B)
MTKKPANVTATLETDAGDLSFEFFPDVAPGHVENFLKLAEQGFYDGTCFHRVIPGFMIQGGDPNTKQKDASRWGTGGPGYKIKAEFNQVHHERGVLSMARSAHPDSAGSQFFVVHGEAGFLDGKYTAFGRLKSGFEALDAIAAAPCHADGEGSRPKNPVRIRKVTVRREDAGGAE